ncbi:hypothetical protein, partial [Streptomyces sp. NL15-2K]|uniref:hypothetical protein n=1 Tax=Streptomyces sp. NL15-2K TaxID=376149 RepID=UPI001C0EDC01
SSSVVASICEVALDISGPIPRPGDAVMRVLNVVPSDRHRDLRISIGWPTDLPFRITLLISND